MTIPIPTRTLCAAVLVVTPSAGASDDPLSRARALKPVVAAQHHEFELTYMADAVRMTARIDTAQPEGGRVAVKTSNLDDQGDYERIVEEMDRAAGRGYWCDEMLKGVGDDAKVLSRTADSVTYTFAPQPTGARNDAVLEHLEGEISLDAETAQVVGYRLTAPKPFRQALVAKINTFEMVMACAPAPNGRTFASNFEMTLQGSAAFRKFSQAFTRSLRLVK